MVGGETGRTENVAQGYASTSKCGISSATADDGAKQTTGLEFLRVWDGALEEHHCLEEGGVRRGTGSHTHEKKGTLVRRRKLHKLKDQGAQARKQC